ncbi:MAG: YbgA family protein, partial [Actinobacteria bacterium]|nr:YbgA family protein [Actinomycetota bacterium]
SSGMERVRVYPAAVAPAEEGSASPTAAAGGRPGGGGPPVRRGVGIFASLFMRRFPLLPVEDEGRLCDPVLRENFIERVFTLRRWRAAMAERPSLAGVVDFHTRHELLVYAHSTTHYRKMGRLVAHGAEGSFDELRQEYQRLLMEALRLIATPSKHRNVLQHAMGHFKRQLTGGEKGELLEVIEAFAAGDLPLIVPVTLLNHYARRERQEFLLAQYYLHPHPLELRLRNHG